MGFLFVFSSIPEPRWWRSRGQPLATWRGRKVVVSYIDGINRRWNQVSNYAFFAEAARDRFLRSEQCGSDACGQTDARTAAWYERVAANERRNGQRKDVVVLSRRSCATGCCAWFWRQAARTEQTTLEASTGSETSPVSGPKLLEFGAAQQRP